MFSILQHLHRQLIRIFQVGSFKEKKNTSFFFLVVVNSYLIISPHHLILDYGDQLELICQTNLVNPLEIQWLHNYQIVNHGNYLTDFSDRIILRISKVTDEHTGVYYCFSNSSINQQMIMSMPVTVTVRRRNEMFLNDERYRKDYF